MIRNDPRLVGMPVVFMYGAEAHAVDEWDIQSARYTLDNAPVCVKQTRCTADRVAAARAFEAKYIDPACDAPTVVMAVDPVDSGLQEIVGSWPLRLVVSSPAGVVLHVSELTHTTHRLPPVFDAWLGAASLAPGPCPASAAVEDLECTRMA